MTRGLKALNYLVGKNGSFVGCGEPGEDTDVEVENCRVVLLGLAPPPPPTRPP